jgi:hypothetical protein
MCFFRYLSAGMDHLQVVKEHVYRTFVAHVNIHISILRCYFVREVGVRFNDTVASYLAESAGYTFELLIKKDVVDIGLGYRWRSGCIGGLTCQQAVDAGGGIAKPIELFFATTSPSRYDV